MPPAPQLGDFVRHAPTSLALFDREMRYLATSARWLDAFGRGHADLTGLVHYDVLPDLPAWWRDVHQRGLAGETVANDHDTWIHADGSKHWLRWSVVPWRDQAGAIGGILISAEDTTDVMRAAATLRESEEKYATLFERSPFAIAVTRLSDLTTVDANAAYLTMFEYRRDEVIGRTSVDLRISDAASRAETLAHVMAHGSVRGYECTRTARSGALRQLSLDIDRIALAGEPHLLTTIRDLTDLKQAEATVAQARSLDELKSQFFANVSHELRTPLTLIQGPAERALGDPSLPEAVRHDLDVVVRNARTLRRHVDDLLDVARVDAGGLTPDLADVDLAALVRFVAGHFDMLARDQRIAFAVEAPATLDAQVDPDQIARVLMNLLSNAFKFTPAGGRVRVGLRGDGEHVVLEVADSGERIAPGQRAAVFERFRQGAARRAGGSGLGLAIAHELVTLHRGDIAIDDAPEGGARFAVRLPRTAPSGVAVRARRDATLAIDPRSLIDELHARAIAVSPPARARDALVLVVDDEPEMNRFVASSLADHYQVLTAHHGAEALALARAHRPDVVITDVMMPQMSGDELVRELRRVPELATTAIVVLTARADDDLRIAMLREGAQDFLVKPFSVAELQVRVANLVARKRAEQQLAEAEAKFRGIVSIAADAIITVDQEQRIVVYNRGAEEIFGWTADEVVGQHLDALLPDRFHTAHHEHLAGFAQSPNPTRRIGESHTTIVGRRKNGEEFPAQVGISRLEVGGTMLFSAVLRDVTEAHAIEAEQRFLAEIGQALAATLELDQMIGVVASLGIRSIADVCIVDLIEANGAPRQLLVMGRDPAGRTACEALERAALEDPRPSLVAAILDRAQSMLLPELRDVDLEAAARSAEHLAALRALAPRSAVGVPLIARGRLLGVMMFLSTAPSRRYGARDLALAEELARRAALALENARLYRTAQQAIRARDDVLGVVAHDLRNPLHQILLEAERHRRAGRDVHAIHDAASHMNRMIQDLLDVARIEAGQLAVERAPIELRAFLRTVIDAQGPIAADASLELRADLPDALPRIAADAGRLRQVLDNLIGNAVKFTPPGGAITVGARAGADGIELWVADTGRGIPADEIPHVFERYWQANRGERHGAGLGLAIVAAIVHAHGGTVRVESRPGQGTRFAVDLPHAEPEAAGPRATAGGRRVLIVDDDEHACAALAELLADEGYQVETASRAADGLDRLGTFHPAVALVDVTMPGMGGIEFVRKARAQLPGLRCILITGHDHGSLALEGAGSLPRVRKPVDIDKLLDLLASSASWPT